MDSPIDTRILTEKFKGLDYLNISVALVDATFSILHYNAAFVRLFQTAAEGNTPKDFYKLFENFATKIESLKQVGLTSGHLLNFVIPSLKLREYERYFDLHVNKLSQEINAIEGFSITCIEVTEREKELKKLSESASQHVKYLQNTNSAVIIHLNGKIVYANPQAHKMIGAAPGDNLVGMDIMSFVPPEFKEIVFERIKKMLESDVPAEPIEEKLIKLDGNILDVEISAFPVTHEGKPAVETIINDITARKRSERQLKESEKKYSNLVENSQDVIFKLDEEQKFTYLNSAWEHLSGFTIEEVLHTSLLNYIPNATDKEKISERITKINLIGNPDQEVVLQLRTKNDELRYVQFKFYGLYNEQNYLHEIGGAITDIHEAFISRQQLQNVELELKHQQKILNELARNPSIVQGNFIESLQLIARVAAETLKTSRVNIWQLSAAGDSFINLVNYDNIKKHYENTEGVLLDKCPKYMQYLFNEKFIVSADCVNDDRYAEFIDNYILPNNIGAMMDSCIISQDKVWGAICFDQVGTTRQWSVEDQLFVNSLASFAAFAYESSQKTQTQAALNQSEELYRYIVENAGEAIFILSEQDTIIELNQFTEQITGYTKNEMQSLPVSELFPITHEGMPLTQEVRLKGQFKEQRKFIRKDGVEGIAEVTANVLPEGKIQVIARDITEQQKQAVALKESETRLELALKGADLGTWDFLIREDKMIHNKRWAEMLGYNFEITVVNEQFWEKFVHPEDIEIANADFQKHLKGEKPFYEATIRMLASNGEWRWILDRGRVVEWDENGEPLRASGIHQDITELKLYEKELQQQRLFLQQIVNIIPYPIYVRNLNNEFVLINNAFASLIGYAKNEILQYQFLKKFKADEAIAKLLESDNDIFLSKQAVHFSEIHFKNTKSGIEQWLQTIKVPLKDSEGNLTELLSVSTNITELKIKEKELAALNEDLEVKVNKRTALLEAANKELETFNYSVSHDLRTPLRTIDIFAYFLEKNYKEILDEEGAANIKQIRQSIMKMTALIDNLLIYSKMGRMDIHHSRFALRDVISEAVSETGKQLDISKVDFRYADLPEVYTDFNLLKQALVNLISNAVKFSSTRSLPIIEFYGETTESTITFSIRDNGVGFSMEFKEKLFKAFKRLHSEEHFEGTGVGLAIVEKIVKRLNGRIWAESEENSGTTFSISLPRNG